MKTLENTIKDNSITKEYYDEFINEIANSILFELELVLKRKCTVEVNELISLYKNMFQTETFNAIVDKVEESFNGFKFAFIDKFQLY